MDIFGTTITAGALIAQFLSSCAAFSDEAKSLKARFDWDLRALQAIRDYFQNKEAINANHQLSPTDAALLEQTAKYLDVLFDKVQQSLCKIERKGFLKDVANHSAWFARQAELKSMEEEVYSWTQRFGVRVLGLPSELKAVIPYADSPTALVKSNDRLRNFVHHALHDEETRAREIFLEDPGDLEPRITDWRDVSFLPLQDGEKQLVFASRGVSPDVIPGTPAFEDLKSEMGTLAAALNCLDPAADVRLLKVEHYFYHAESGQFLFPQIAPYPIVSMMTLGELIGGDPFPETDAGLGQRLNIAQKLAEAVFFLHTAGFLHKKITSSSVVALRRPNYRDVPAFFLDDVYLMGFDLIRGAEARTTKEGAIAESNEPPRSIWDFKVYQHPDRQQEERCPRYIKTYDVYSLGVVLLEIGLWQQLFTANIDLDEEDPSNWPRRLSELALQALVPRVGEKYQRLVSWCLAVDASEIVKETEFVQQVLDPLESLCSIIC